MRRIWAILSAVGYPAFGGALTAPYPAAAATARSAPSGRPFGWVSPGGPGDLMTTLPFRSVHGHRETTVSSSNWAGDAATTTQYTSVAASWVQPAGQCSRGDQYSAFWVGLDGYNSP